MTVERAGQSCNGGLVIDLVICDARELLLRSRDPDVMTYGDGRSAAGDGDLLSVVDGGVGGSGHDGGGQSGDGGVLELHLEGRGCL